MRGKLQFAIVLCGAALTAAAQQGTPHAGYVYPAGGKQGTSFEAVVGGQYLNGVNGVLLTGEGVRITVGEYTRPLPPNQASQLRDRMKELMEKRTSAMDANNAKGARWTDADEQEVRDIRVKLALFQKQRRTINPAIAEMVHVTVRIADNAPSGRRELRMQTQNGITNPLYFYVGHLPEWSKTPAGLVSKEEMAALAEPGALKRILSNPQQQAAVPATPAVEVDTPILVNGQIEQGGVDTYRFNAHKGEHLVIAASAREIIPYIADAVPGWFQASLTLYGPDGREITYADHYSYHPDPVMLYDAPADGQYTVSIHDSIYRGREDFVYRLAIGEIPFVTAMYPLGGRAGAKTTVEFTGVNLAQTRLTERSRDKDKGMELLSPGEEEFTARPFALDTLPETQAREENHTRTAAQKIPVPVIVNGRVARPGEWEYFQFRGHAADVIEAEVYARRLGSPLDSVLTLTDASGKALATNDDFVDESEGLMTDHADSLIRYKLPADGTYYLRLGDSVGKGGPEFAYRLHVSHPNPDFELRVVPSSVNVRAGQIVPIQVHVLRRGGFDGDVLVKLKDAPPGFQLSGGVVPSGQTKANMTLDVPYESAAPRTSRLAFAGFATIGGHDVRRMSVAADDREQAFFYHHLVTTGELTVTVTGRQRQLDTWAIHSDHAIALFAGGMVGVKINMTAELGARVHFELSDPPAGVSVDHVSPYADGGVTIHLRADGDKAKAGLRGNLLLSATVDRPNTSNKGKKQTTSELLPAIPFEVFAPARVPPANQSASLPSHP